MDEANPQLFNAWKLFGRLTYWHGPVALRTLTDWRVRLSVQDTALSRLKDGFDSRTRYHEVVES